MVLAALNSSLVMAAKAVSPKVVSEFSALNFSMKARFSLKTDNL